MQVTQCFVDDDLFELKGETRNSVGTEFLIHYCIRGGSEISSKVTFFLSFSYILQFLQKHKIAFQWPFSTLLTTIVDEKQKIA